MKVFSVLFISYIGFALNYGLNKYLTKHLDLHGLGDFNVGLGIATIFGIILTYGGNASTKRFIPQYFLEKNYAAIAGCIRYYIRKILGLSLWLFVLFLISLFVFSIFDLEEMKHGAHEIILLAPVIAVGMLLGSVLQARHKAWMSLSSDKLIKPGLFLLGCFIWLEVLGPPGLLQVILIAFLVLFATAFIELYLVNKVLPFNFMSVIPVSEKGEWNKVGVPLLYTALATTVFINIEILALELFHPGEKEIGVFSLLVFVVSIVWINFSSICSVVIPKVSEARDDTEELQKIYSRGVLWIFLSNVVFAVLIWSFSHEILNSFNSGMPEYTFWLKVILVGSCLNSMLDFNSVFLRFTGYQQKAKQNIFFVLAVNLFLSPLLVFFFGLPGAVFTLISVNFLRGVNGARLMKKYTGIKPLIYI